MNSSLSLFCALLIHPDWPPGYYPLPTLSTSLIRPSLSLSLPPLPAHQSNQRFLARYSNQRISNVRSGKIQPRRFERHRKALWKAQSQTQEALDQDDNHVYIGWFMSTGRTGKEWFWVNKKNVSLRNSGPQNENFINEI